MDVFAHKGGPNVTPNTSRKYKLITNRGSRYNYYKINTLTFQQSYFTLNTNILIKNGKRCKNVDRHMSQRIHRIL